MRTAPVAALVALFAAAAAPPAPAQTLPDRTAPYVNDHAGMIEDAAEARIAAQLAALADETGIEATVLTVPSRDGRAPSASVEAFALAVFDGWALGRAGRDDGLLLVVVAADRAARIELGAGYDQGYDPVARDIVTRTLVPAIRAGEASKGIEAAAGEMADRIGRRLAEKTGATGKENSVGMSGRDWVLAALFGGAAAAIALRPRRRGGNGPGGGADAGPVRRRGERPDQTDPRDSRGNQGEAGPGAGEQREGGRSDGGGATGRW